MDILILGVFSREWGNVEQFTKNKLKECKKKIVVLKFGSNAGLKLLFLNFYLLLF
jgi:hypothetical protein